jgi:hypothetical protein
MTLQAIINVQVRELKDSNLIVKQKALIAARELLGSSTSYVQCIAHGITPAVIALLQVRAHDVSFVPPKIMRPALV